MSGLTDLWSITSFRQAFLELSEADEDQLQQLVKYVEAQLVGEPLVDDAALLNKETRRFVPVLQALVQIRNSDGLDDLIADLERLTDGSSSDKLIPLIRRLLSEGDAERDRRRIHEVQHSVLPLLERMTISVDFRTAPASRDHSPAVVVPVLLVSMAFDEQIGGNESIVFQVPDRVAKDLPNLLKRADAARSEMISRLGRENLPSGLLPSLWGDENDDSRQPG